MGPTTLFHLGGDDGGLTTFCERYADSFNRWWDDLGRPHLDEATAGKLVDGLSSVPGADDIEKLAARRDALVTALVAATHPRDRA